jgi:hypothetical protein
MEEFATSEWGKKPFEIAQKAIETTMKMGSAHETEDKAR